MKLGLPLVGVIEEAGSDQVLKKLPKGLYTVQCVFVSMQYTDTECDIIFTHIIEEGNYKGYKLTDNIKFKSSTIAMQEKGQSRIKRICNLVGANPYTIDIETLEGKSFIVEIDNNGSILNYN